MDAVTDVDVNVSVDVDADQVQRSQKGGSRHCDGEHHSQVSKPRVSKQ
jgi:hypothetical protein